MLELFAPVRDLIREDSICIDNLIFRLHSSVTVVILTVCSVLVSTKQLFGEPITCITDGAIDTEPVNAYCWIYSTFTVKRHLRGILGRQIAAPGVGQALEKDELLHHRYYQWVCLVLLLQAALFYAPRLIWKAWEGGVVGLLVNEVNAETWTPETRARILSYFAQRGRNFYALRYFACEIFNLINTVSQIYFLDLFLEGQFSGYGAAVAALNTETAPFQRTDPMARLFPKLTKCTLHTFGASGSSQTHDALCVLPLNVINEKIYVFLWFWLPFLLVVGSVAIIYRLAVITQPWLRVILLQASVRGLGRRSASRLAISLSFGDWFVLRRLVKNVKPVVYRNLLFELAEGLPKHEA